MKSFLTIALTLSVLVLSFSALGRALPGGLTEVPLDDPDVLNMATFAASSIGNDFNLHSVLRARSQVVAGLLYHLRIKITKPRPGMPDQIHVCNVQVHYQAWIPSTSLKSSRCNPAV